MTQLGVPASVADIPTGLKCIKVYIPDGTDIHLYALRGQLSNLGKSWWWDTGGDVELARDIASWWIAASEATDLTIACEDCDMAECNVNVNVNCGCGGGIPTTILCYDQDGNPAITPQPPVEPTIPNPVGETWPINPTEDTAPDAFGDWTTFDVEACAAANGLWQAVYAMVTWAEGGIDLIATVATVIAFLIPGIGTAIVAALGGTAVVSLASVLVKIILSEQASDILNECRLWLETNKKEIICTIFQYRYDLPTMQIQLVRMWFAWVDVALDLSDVDQDIVREWGRAIFPLNLLLAYFFEYQRYIEASSPIDCSTCAIGPITDTGYILVPVHGSLMTLTSDSHVTQATSNNSVYIRKPTLHWGSGYAQFTFTEVATYHGLTGVTPLAWCTRLDAASHYGWPEVGSYSTVINPGSVSNVGQICLISIADLDAEISAIDGGDFKALFDITTFPGMPLPASPQAGLEFLNHANIAYDGSAVYRLWALFRID